MQVETGRLPGPYDEADANRLVEIAVSLQAESKAEDGAEPAALADASRDVLKTLSYVAAAELSPMAAFLGGMVGQEIVKAVSGKFMPLLQWFHFDSIESLPDEKPSAEDVAPQVLPPLVRGFNSCLDRKFLAIG
jgi:ubiquitin-activating enzyme E1